MLIYLDDKDSEVVLESLNRSEMVVPKTNSDYHNRISTIRERITQLL